MEKKASTQSVLYQKIGHIIKGVGAFVVLSGLLVNPWLGRFYRRNIIEYQDVMLTYFIWAVSIGLIIIGLGIMFRRVKSPTAINMIVLSFTCLLIILSDRVLLAWYGLPLWIADVEKHYSHRPNTIRLWGPSFDNKLIRINQYGHHDNNFPIDKADDEFRGLMIGDSITMGHGMIFEDTFPNQLEDIFREKNGDHITYQMINAGVQGYSTFQEYHSLMESLQFNPDFVALGFCMNDLSEPFVVDKRFGGVGFDYHGIAQASSHIISYILNETGYGRWQQNKQKRGKSLEVERRWEAFSIGKVAQSRRDDPQFALNWETTFAHLDKIYNAAKDKNIRLVLMIFPHTFQFMNDRMKEPQRQLIEHAKSKNIDVIDFTQVFEELIFDEHIESQLSENGFSLKDMRRMYNPRIRKYYLDSDHYTVEGHRVVANHLYSYLSEHFSP